MTLPRWAAIATMGAVGVATALLAGVVLWAAELVDQATQERMRGRY